MNNKCEKVEDRDLVQRFEEMTKVKSFMRLKNLYVFRNFDAWYVTELGCVRVDLWSRRLIVYQLDTLE